MTPVNAGPQTGFWLWLGFNAPFSLDKVLFGRGPVKVWAINNAYQLTGMLLLGAILAVWQ